MTNAEKKIVERRIIQLARRAGLPLPSGELLDREQPDFQIGTDPALLGIEVTAVIPPPRHPSFNSPLAECDKYEGVIRTAESNYARIPGAVQVKVTVYRGRLREREEWNAKWRTSLWISSAPTRMKRPPLPPTSGGIGYREALAL
jgi:hypothetical protein